MINLEDVDDGALFVASCVKGRYYDAYAVKEGSSVYIVEYAKLSLDELLFDKKGDKGFFDIHAHQIIGDADAIRKAKVITDMDFLKGVYHVMITHFEPGESEWNLKNCRNYYSNTDVHKEELLDTVRKTLGEFGCSATGIDILMTKSFEEAFKNHFDYKFETIFFVTNEKKTSMYNTQLM